MTRAHRTLAALSVVVLLAAAPSPAVWAQETPDPETPVAETPVAEPTVAEPTVAGSYDPVSLWPAPYADTQLVGIDAYLRYHRADGRSLLSTATADNPIRIWAGGDSLSGGPVLGLGELVDADPTIQLTEEIRKSTGNVSDWYFNWPQHMADEIADGGYDVIVLSMGGNDKQKFRGTTEKEGTEPWNQRYRERVRALIAAAQRPTRLVVWVGVPHLRPPHLRDLPGLVNPLVREVLAEFENTMFVSAADLVSPDGSFTRALNGRNVRTADGVHYTHYGGELVSQPILDEIARRSG